MVRAALLAAAGLLVTAATAGANEWSHDNRDWRAHGQHAERHFDHRHESWHHRDRKWDHRYYDPHAYTRRPIVIDPPPRWVLIDPPPRIVRPHRHW
jgi:hypothetical protein